MDVKTSSAGATPRDNKLYLFLTVLGFNFTQKCQVHLNIDLVSSTIMIILFGNPLARSLQFPCALYMLLACYVAMFKAFDCFIQCN